MTIQIFTNAEKLLSMLQFVFFFGGELFILFSDFSCRIFSSSSSLYALEQFRMENV